MTSAHDSIYTFINLLCLHSFHDIDTILLLASKFVIDTLFILNFMTYFLIWCQYKILEWVQKYFFSIFRRLFPFIWLFQIWRMLLENTIEAVTKITDTFFTVLGVGNTTLRYRILRSFRVSFLWLGDKNLLVAFISFLSLSLSLSFYLFGIFKCLFLILSSSS